MTGRDDEIAKKLTAFTDLLRKWNATINLVGAADMPHLWPRHIEDSLQLGVIAGPLPPRAIDLGSGAGFPGLILSIAYGIEVDLIEQDKRKAAFLREAVFVTGAPARVHAVKIERANVPPAPLVVSRALAPLPALLRFAAPLLLEDEILPVPEDPRVFGKSRKRNVIGRCGWSGCPGTTDPDGVASRISALRSLA